MRAPRQYSALVITRMSELFVRTLREDPADAEVPSHRWLVRAGYIRRAAPGIYSWLPLGYRVLRNVERIVREEMNAIGAQEVHFPALLPKEPYEASGRWTEYGDGVFRLMARLLYGCGLRIDEAFAYDPHFRVYRHGPSRRRAFRIVG